MPLFIRYGIVVVVVVLDQITKIWADRSLALYEQIQITGFFNITKAYNYGAAFSFLDNEGGWQRWFFTAISFIVSVVGNLIDRAWYGYVVDFIQVHWNGSYFPSFNIADAAISCGTVVLLLLTLFEKNDVKSDVTS